VISGPGGAPDRLLVSDLPLQATPQLGVGSMVQAIEHVLRRRGFRAGRWTIGYQSCDNSTAQSGLFDVDKCVSNARAYVADPAISGIVGLHSWCAQAQLPVANRAALAMAGPFTYADGSRPSVTRALLTTPRGQGLLGTTGFEPTGDPLLRTVTVLRPRRAGGSDDVYSHDGAMIEGTIEVPLPGR